MKIEQIDLKAFGHFTDQSLSLNGTANFHIICGPNEAGKTTLWRAINCALFGIPHSSKDAFLHDTKNLRVGLALKAQSGKFLNVMRRKGNKNTLLKYDPVTGAEVGEIVAEDTLRDWLGGLSEGLFLAMFSLDHDALVRGGEALAQGGGDAGESLFEAGAGLKSIRSLREKLSREAESLFKPRASTPAINKALSEFESARKQAREAAVRPAEWTSAKTTMEAAAKEYEAARKEQSRLQMEARRMDRLAVIFPDVAALDHAEQSLAELSDVPLLPSSAPAERIAAVTKMDEAAVAERSARQRLEHRQKELAAIQLNEAVLTNAESIEAIHHATTAYREASIQVAKAEASIEDAQNEFDTVLKQISGDEKPDNPLLWLPDPTRVAKIRTLITMGATLKATHLACLKTLGEKKLEIEQLDSEILGLGQEEFSADLGAYLDSIADLGDPEARAQQLEDEVTSSETKLDTEALSLKMASTESVTKTTAPLDAELQSYKAEDEELRRRTHLIRESIENIEDDLADLQAEIKGLEVRGDVPTKEAVTGAREKRDTLWLGIRRHFMPKPGESDPVEPRPTAEGFEHAVTSADSAADGLFADAERATRYAEFRVRESQMQRALELEKTRAASVSKEHEELAQRWSGLLARHGLPSLTITEAPQWLSKRDAFLQRFEASQTRQQEAERNRSRVLEIRTRLTEIYGLMSLPAPALSERLSETLARARTIAKRYAEQLTERQLKKTQRSNAEATLKHAEAAESTSHVQLDAWNSNWSEVMATIRLTGDASEDEATARLEQFAEFKQAHDALERFRIEQRNAQIQIDDYQSRLTETWSRVYNQSLPSEGHSHDILSGEIYRELTFSRTQQEKKNTLTEQIADDQNVIKEARQAAEEAAAIIKKLLLQAGCSTPDNLELIEEKSAQRTALEAEVRNIESRLIKSSGLPLGEALRQAKNEDPDAIADALNQNAQLSEENAAQVQQRHEDYLAARRAFEKMDGSAVAADAQQKMAQHASHIAERGADYAVSRIASAVLSQVIDAYQKRNQGPLIEWASQRFSVITNGRYTGIVIDFDEERQILKAVRADGQRLSMDELSTGRRDQLFLALRLAAIEQHLENGEPLPVIVDDILIQFDDEAAAATFKVLADLSQRTQVLFLTHHEHLLDVAQSAIGRDAYQPHRLGA
jgi:uncharacterized protein YhaN